MRKDRAFKSSLNTCHLIDYIIGSRIDSSGNSLNLTILEQNRKIGSWDSKFY